MNILQPKTGALPDDMSEEELLVMNDVHRGPMTIWVGMQGTLFCDIDGTVADLTHRRKYLDKDENGRKNYAMFERTMGEDSPINHVIEGVRLLYQNDWKVVMCSGRRETSRQITERWLDKYGVPYDALYMRREFLLNEDGTRKLTRKKDKFAPDYRSDYIVKKELLDWARADGHDPDVVFDDRDQVVAMWREHDIPVVQVAEGDF